jgi:cytochrome b
MKMPESPGAAVLVWDAPVRVFHWLLVLSFAGAYLSAESERWRLVHVTLGYTVGGLVAFRLLWGVLGTRYARFANFVRGPRVVLAYMQSMLRRQPEHHTGHNPAGAVAIVALLLLAMLTVGFGWATYDDLGGEWLAEVHGTAGNLMLGVVGVHLAGVVAGSWLHRENLVRAMFTGLKRGYPNEAIRRAFGLVAALLLAVVVGYWVLAWREAPTASNLATPVGRSAAPQPAPHA